MSPADETAEQATMNDALDRALHALFRDEPDVADEGFSQRLVAALPQQRRPGTVNWPEWTQRAQWAAMSLAAGALAVLHASGKPPSGAEAGAACALIGLLAFWSLPLRWSPG